MSLLDVARHFLSTTAHTAASIVNVPSNGLASVTVQNGLNELQTDINAINLATSYTDAAMSGDLTLEGTLYRSMFLNPNGAQRNVNLPSTNVRKGDKIRITNTSTSSAYNQQFVINSSTGSTILVLGSTETAAMYGFVEIQAQKDSPTLSTDWNMTALRDYWYIDQSSGAVTFSTSATPATYNFTIKRNFSTISIYGYTSSVAMNTTSVWQFQLPSPLIYVMRVPNATTEILSLCKIQGSNTYTLFRITNDGKFQYYYSLGAGYITNGYTVQLVVIGSEQVHVATYTTN